MLSMTPLKDAAAAKSYYEKDNYYAKDSPEAAELSHWWGKGAQKLGLSGYVAVAMFEQLLEGKLPNGIQLGRIDQHGQQHRPGYDLTFSAPKSVSVLAEVGNDRRIHAAHQQAVTTALRYLEASAIETRAFRQGQVVFERVDNLAVALFRHDTSREMDPATHTHCVVLNAVERQDGKWCSISSEALFDHKMTAGMIYRAQLAHSLQQLGYQIEKTHDDGRFEIVGVPQEVITHFSQRRQQIEERLEAEGWEGAKASAKVTLATRKRKVSADRGDLQANWQTRCAELGFDPQQLIVAAHERAQKEPLVADVAVALDAVRYATAHLSEREAVFAEREIIREALAHALGATTLKAVEMGLKQLIEAGELLPANHQHWTTPAALAMEKRTIVRMQQAKNQCTPIAEPTAVQAFIQSKEESRQMAYTAGQREAITLLLTTPDQIVGVQGNAGTGKTTMLKAVYEMAEGQGYELIGIAPTKKAAQELQQKTGMVSYTVPKFLIEAAKTKDQTPKKPQLLILDEASMVSSRQMRDLLAVLKTSQTRLAMIGDIKQLAAIEAGKPFDQLQLAGMATAHMREIVRQDNPELKSAIELTLKQQIAQAFAKMPVKEISHKDERLQYLVERYLQTPVSARDNLMVLAPANEDREVINAGIRQGLKKEGVLHGAITETDILQSRGFSRTYRTRVTNYAVGDIVRFNKRYKNLQVTAGDYWRVSQIERSTNTLVLENSQGKTIEWNPEKLGGKRDGAVEVYQKQKRELMAGDQIRWLRNQGNDIINAQTATVLAVHDCQAEVLLENQKRLTLDLKNPQHQHWDYAFAYTLHAKQGGENIRVVALMESFRKKLATQQAFYVAITRAQSEVELVVDDKAQCIKTIEKHTGAKLSALGEFSGNDLDVPITAAQTKAEQMSPDEEKAQAAVKKNHFSENLSEVELVAIAADILDPNRQEIDYYQDSLNNKENTRLNDTGIEEIKNYELEDV